MSEHPFLSLNGADPAEQWSNRLAAVARALPYPPTPNLAAAVLPRTRQLAVAPLRSGPTAPAPVRPRLAGAAVGLLALLLALLAVPAVRAGVVEFLQLGAVRILLGPAPTATASPAAPTATGARLATATPRPSPTPLSSLLALRGQTTLDQARRQVGFPIRLPAYPADLGEPDAVFVQDLDGSAVVLVWLDPDDPARVDLSLHLLTNETIAFKNLRDGPAAAEIQPATVNGQPAVWVTGEYILQMQGGDFNVFRLIDGRVLIWTEGQLTYRLETDLPLEDAVRIAESLE